MQRPAGDGPYDWVVATSPHVGTLGEKPLHASLKRWYAETGDRAEVSVDEFVVDLVRGDLLIEIQTRGFSSLKRKLTKLLDRGHPVRIIYPIPVAKWIVKRDAAGAEMSRRRSPKRGSACDVFAELVSFPDLIAHPRLEIELLFIHEEEFRRHDPTRAWRRRGWVIDERHLVGVVDVALLRGPEDLVELLPEGLPEPFTTADLAAAWGRPRRIGQQAAYCLRRAGAVVEDGRQGNAVEYVLAHRRPDS